MTSTGACSAGEIRILCPNRVKHIRPIIRLASDTSASVKLAPAVPRSQNVEPRTPATPPSVLTPYKSPKGAPEAFVPPAKAFAYSEQRKVATCDPPETHDKKSGGKKDKDVATAVPVEC